MTLVQVQTSPKESMLIDDDTAPLEDLLTEETDIASIEDFLAIDTTKEDEISILEDTVEELTDEDTEKHEIEDNNELFDLILPDTPEETIDEDTAPLEDLLAEENEISILDDALEEVHDADTEKNKIEDNNELFDLILPTAPEETIDKIAITKDEQAVTADEDQSPIVIDIEQISQSIGISTEDYNIFLNEYIDTALSLENDLQSTQEEKRTRAIGTLSHLSNVLHLPVVTEIVTQIGNASIVDQDTYIESFYTTLGRLTTSQLDTVKEETSPIPELDSEIKVDTVDSVDIASIDLYEEEAPSEAEAESVTITEGFGTISLDDVKPIHFDFQLEQAANDLSLPVELIEEFVHDFIGQAHTETEKMLEAYEKGDLDTIQKIGHLLKGTSSNLRITALSDTLYEIQFCEDSSKLENLIKQYWGHFLSLETQINLTSK